MACFLSPSFLRFLLPPAIEQFPQQRALIHRELLQRERSTPGRSRPATSQHSPGPSRLRRSSVASCSRFYEGICSIVQMWHWRLRGFAERRWCHCPRRSPHTSFISPAEFPQGEQNRFEFRQDRFESPCLAWLSSASLWAGEDTGRPPPSYWVTSTREFSEHSRRGISWRRR